MLVNCWFATKHLRDIIGNVGQLKTMTVRYLNRYFWSERMPVVNLTESRIRDLEPGSGIWRDEQVKGLMVIAHKSTKTYAVHGYGRINGRPVRRVRVKVDRVGRIAHLEARCRGEEPISQLQL